MRKEKNLTKDRSYKIKKASWIGIIGNGILAIAKIIIGIISGSLAVIGDGIDSTTDVLTYIITLITARIISKPPDSKYPYGYKKAETSATKILAFIIFFAGAQLLISTTKQLISGEIREMPSMIAIYVTLFSIAGKVILAMWQFRMGKKTDSKMIIANARNMRNDIIISGSVLIGLAFTFILEMPVFDSIIALLVSLWIIKEAFGIYRESNLEMMDGVKDTNIYFKIIKSVDDVEGAHNPHRIRVRNIANLLLITLDIEVDQNIKVSVAHDIAKHVENMLKKNIDNIFDILVHVEPLGNIEQDESFGISKDNIIEDSHSNPKSKK
ncbi:MAG: cation diffusion facilitator family transporter [Bacteroidales bacterium]|nr:cation diffusion facilitator family transporter [Bacteroidales bacterium]